MSRTKAPTPPQAPRRPPKGPKPQDRPARPVVPPTDAARDALLSGSVRAIARKLRKQARKRKHVPARRQDLSGTTLKDRKGVQPGGPAGQQLATAVANETERRYRAFQLKLAGATYKAIGEQLGVSAKCALLDVHQVLREYADALQAMAGDARALAIAETYKVQLAMAVPMERGDASAAKVFLQCIDMRARLQGTYAPLKVAATDPGGTRPYAQAAMDSLRAEVAQFFGIQVPAPGEPAQAAPQPQLPAAPVSRIPVYDPTLDGPDEPGPAIDTTAVVPATSNGHQPPPADDGDYQGEGGS